MKTLAVIPARAGSKRIAGKNIKPLNGKPLIAYTIEAALAAQHIDRVIVSTDGEEIAEVARSFGAEVPFMRPAELATDKAADKPLYRHALESLSSAENYEPDAVAVLRPTNPLRTVEVIDQSIEFMLSTKADSVRSVTKVEGVKHPYWMYNMGPEGEASGFIPEVDITVYYQSQLLPPCYRLNGVADVIKSDIIMDGTDVFYGGEFRIFEVEEAISIDIDTELDFQIAEAMLKSGGSAS